MIGQTISQYKILEKLGEGGMGVVYKAQDTKLDRFVALKFLPAHLAASEQDKARFIQEAKAASALNHPNVCTIHDIQEYEDPQGGKQMFIVMEFIDGQTLQEKKGSLTQKQAIDYGIQIADGLAAAHEKGIVHRDIKPENIMIRKDGIVQVMDFGLAKLVGVSRLTKQGATVGTLGYMSPEQVQGQETDHRSDIFSFGVVLYEMLTGRSPFNGAHESAILYEIVNVDVPPMSTIKPEIDAELDRIVLECMEKDPNERMQSIKQVAIDLNRFKRTSSRTRLSRTFSTASFPKMKPESAIQSDSSALASRSFLGMPRQSWIVISVLLILVCVLAYKVFLSPIPDKVVIRATINAPAKTNFQFYGNTSGPAVLSPDGKYFAFTATDSTGKNGLYLRGIDDLSPHRLPETDGASQPFWSPDDRFIAFAAGGKLKKIDVAGGVPVTICDAPFSRGGTWNNDGMIVFAPGPSNPLVMVPAKGGNLVRVTTLDSSRGENSHRWPWFLPDGKHFLYLARTVATGSRNEGDAICVGSIDGKESQVLARTSSNAQFASGYLLFTRGGSLVAQRMDEHSFELAGEPITIASGLAFDQSVDRSMFTVSQNGLLLYQTGSVQLGSKIVFMDRSGKKTGEINSELAEYYLPRLSPDGKKLACYIYDFQSHNADIWIQDLSRGLKTRFTFTPTFETYSVWSPNGREIVYSANSAGKYDLYRKSADGAGTEEALLRNSENKFVVDWSSDGKFILYTSAENAKGQTDLWILPMSGDKKPFPFLKTEFNEKDARFSPDSKWVAYASDESGKDEIYVRSFPEGGSKRQVSVDGGDSPRWRRDGKELYYFSLDNKMMAADISYREGAMEIEHVRPLFELPAIVAQPYADYDVFPDGKKFLVNVPFESQNSTPLTLVVNWETEVQKK